MGFFSGRQVAHPTDCFIRNVMLISLAVLGGLLLYDRITETNKQTGRPTVDCWFPPEFTDNQVKTALSMCSSQGKHYHVYNDKIPTTKRNESILNIYPSTQGANKNIFYQSATILEIFVTCQAVLAVVAFLLLKNVACRAGTQARILAAGLGGSPLQLDAARGLKRAFCTTVTYIIIQVGYFIAIAVMIGKLRQVPANMWTVQAETLKPKSTEFLCDFKIRMLGNVRRYTAQCVSIPADPLPESTTKQLVLYLDTVLCGAVALMVLLHLVQTLLLSSASSDVMAAYDLQSPPGIVGRITFGCTDMNLAAIFLNVIGHPQIVMMSRYHDRVNSAPVYSDALHMDQSYQKPSLELV